MGGYANRAAVMLGVLILATTALTGCLGGGSATQTDPHQNADAKEFSLTISSNAIADGKNSEGAKWIEEWVIPRFEAAQKKKGVTADVSFAPAGVEDAEYKNQLGLDLEAGKGSDIMDIDGIWVGEFAESGFLAPLSDVVGKQRAKDWDGWEQIPDSVRANSDYGGKRYGVPRGTDGRLLYFNKKIFEAAGLDTDWQPKSWDDVLDTAEKIGEETDGVTPIQLNAGTAMGESTTMESFLPLLAGTGKQIHSHGQWLGNHASIRQVLGAYENIYSGGLGDATLQAEAQGRQKSQSAFAAGEMGILAESDYLWRDVIAPDSKIAPMKDRDSEVGFARIPAREPGAGVGGQDFVSMSGGGTHVINPNTNYPQQAWELLRFMNSAEALKAEVEDTPRITARADVNKAVLADDPLLSFVSREVVPLTRFRPSHGDYVAVSTALQEATYEVVDGGSAEAAAKNYQARLEDIVGADAVTSS